MQRFKELEGLRIPEHVAIIMDGNGRWAQEKGKKRTYGHRKGAETLKEATRAFYEAGVKYVTVYAFSTENWKRSDEEVDFLMDLMRSYLKESIKTAKKDNMRIRVLGRRNDLPEDIRTSIERLEEASKAYTGMNLQLAINYGGRDEIVRAVNKQIESGGGKVTEESFGHLLDTVGIPDPDIMIRTSGEYRLSNYLIWQLAYAEYMFVDKNWPDFNDSDVVKVIQYFNKRDRRFGGVRNEN